MTAVRLLVFAREPLPGRAKTRLIPALGDRGAAALYRLLLEHILARLAADRIGGIELWVDRGPVGPWLREQAAAIDAAVRVQAEGDLGRRMAFALQETLAAGALPILVGSDVPALTAEHVAEAAGALRRGNDAVLAPADDGGYGLIGVSRELPELFVDMPWGGADVMAMTRERLRAHGRNWAELATVWDVDEPADLARLAAVPELADWRDRLGEAGPE